MTGSDIAVLAQLDAWAFTLVLVMSRVGAACILLPGLGEQDVPAPARIGFALALTALLCPLVTSSVPPVPADAFGLLRLVAIEVAAGLLLGWMARLALLAFGMAGQFIASLTGLANVLQPDPTLGPQTAALGRLFALAAPVLVLASGLARLPIAAIAGSYRTIPVGAALPSQDIAEAAVGVVAETFALALQLAGPFVLADIVWQVALGLLARLVPQLQSYFAALPGQIMGGMALLAVAAAALATTWEARTAALFAALPGAHGL